MTVFNATIKVSRNVEELIKYALDLKTWRLFLIQQGEFK